MRLLLRSCDKSKDILAVLVGMIRSVASGRDARKKQRVQPVDPGLISSAAQTAWSNGDPSPEDEAIAKSCLARTLKLIEEVFKDKPLLRKLAHGRCLGLEGKELQDFARLDDRMMASNFKTLARYLSRVRDAL